MFLAFVITFVSFYNVFITASPIASERAVSGCGTPHPIGSIGLTTYHGLESGGKSRSYSIHLPSGYDRNREYPVVVGFHGSDSIGLFLELDTGLSLSKYSGNKIMVYPNGVDGAWAGPSYAKTSVAEDLAFVSDLLKDIRSNYCIDNQRIYATGMSNGGGFVGTLACSAVGGEFAAFAPVSGSFYTDVNGPDNGCAPARSPLPILEFHGGDDKSVPYAGGQGEGGREPPIPDWLEYWVSRTDCSNKTQVDTFDGDVHLLSWTCDGIKGALQHYKVDDMGHQWPSTVVNFSGIAAGKGPTHIDASALIIQFFDRFTKP
ncbi:carbohydrate esterase family 1 protein [Tothia fuscella]|uniref:feruloyl esterase n=1 Tax=Tothia fuscella TaxID=1048955 RepID=A0A9P4P199_9PEZI|nr:carbohydrate esterase family 1 protein [Tothia fuscella]